MSPTSKRPQLPPRETKIDRLRRQASAVPGLAAGGLAPEDATVVYQRYSVARQGERSVERQDDTTLPFARGLGSPILAVYVDRARSGTTVVGRTALSQMQRDAEAGKFNKLVLDKLDRLGRDVADLHAICARLRAHGIAIYEADGSQITDVTLTFKAVFAQGERDVILARTYAGRKRATRTGRVCQRVRFGYQRDPRSNGVPGLRVIHPQRAPFVLAAFEEYDAGVGMAEIASRMTGRIHTPATCVEIDAGRVDAADAPLAPWSSQMVGDMLGSPIYKGTLLDCRTRVVRSPVSNRVTSYVPRDVEEWAHSEVAHLTIVPPPLFDRCFARMTRERDEGRSAENTRTGLLTGRVLCGLCGTALATYAQHGTRRFKCVDPCPGVGRPSVASVEDAALAALEGLLSDSTFAGLYAEMHGAHVEHLREMFGRERTALEAEMERCRDELRFAGGRGRELFGPRTLDSVANDAGERLRAAERRLEALPDRGEPPRRIDVGRIAEGFAAMRARLPFRGLVRSDAADPEMDADSRSLVRSVRELVAEVVVPPASPSAPLTMRVRTGATIECPRTPWADAGRRAGTRSVR